MPSRTIGAKIPDAPGFCVESTLGRGSGWTDGRAITARRRATSVAVAVRRSRLTAAGDAPALRPSGGETNTTEGTWTES